MDRKGGCDGGRELRADSGLRANGVDDSVAGASCSRDVAGHRPQFEFRQRPRDVDARVPAEFRVDDRIATACCGYPIVDSELRWHPRIYVSGPLAELELGPVSRNIAGARRAGDRIVDAIRPKSAVRT